MKNNFYVYEHWRLDKDECFYVGKGNAMSEAAKIRESKKRIERSQNFL